MNDHYIDALAYSLAIQIAPKITKRRRKPSLRKIRRHRKYFRLMRRIVKNMQRSKAFSKAVIELTLFGRTELYVDLKMVKGYLK